MKCELSRELPLLLIVQNGVFTRLCEPDFVDKVSGALNCSIVTWSASRKETTSRVATADHLWTMQSTHSLSVPGGALKGRLSVGQWAHNSPLTRWSLSCSSLNKNGYLSSHSSPWWWRPGSSMGVQSAATTGASRNRIGACTRGPASWESASFGGGIALFLPWLARLVGLPNGRVAMDGSPGRTDDGRVVRDFKLKPTTREV